MLPEETQLLCTKFLELVNSRPQHNLEGKERLNIYHSFGFSRLDKSGYVKRDEQFSEDDYHKFIKNELLTFNVADYTLSWLAIITANYVLPVWNEAKSQLSNIGDFVPFEKVIETSKDLLQHKIKVAEAIEAQEEYYWQREYLARKVTYNVDCAYGAADDALGFILFGLPKGKNFTPDGENSDWFVTNALEAYTAIDRNRPGALIGTISDFFTENLSKVLKIEDLPENHSNSEPIFDIEYDLQKRLEFWTWWLTEAIPQAWELAHTNYHP